MALNEGLVSFRITGVNAKTLGATIIIPAQTGKFFVPEGLIIRRTTFTSGGGAAPHFGVGNDGTSYTNIFADRILGGPILNEVKLFWPDSAIDSGALAVDLGTAIRFNISTASTCTTDTIEAILKGYIV